MYEQYLHGVYMFFLICFFWISSRTIFCMEIETSNVESNDSSKLKITSSNTKFDTLLEKIDKAKNWSELDQCKNEYAESFQLSRMAALSKRLSELDYPNEHDGLNKIKIIEDMDTLEKLKAQRAFESKEYEFAGLAADFSLDGLDDSKKPKEVQLLDSNFPKDFESEAEQLKKQRQKQKDENYEKLSSYYDQFIKENSDYKNIVKNFKSPVEHSEAYYQWNKKKGGQYQQLHGDFFEKKFGQSSESPFDKVDQKRLERLRLPLEAKYEQESIFLSALAHHGYDFWNAGEKDYYLWKMSGQAAKQHIASRIASLIVVPFDFAFNLGINTAANIITYYLYGDVIQEAQVQRMHQESVALYMNNLKKYHQALLAYNQAEAELAEKNNDSEKNKKFIETLKEQCQISKNLLAVNQQSLDASIEQLEAINREVLARRKNRLDEKRKAVTFYPYRPVEEFFLSSFKGIIDDGRDQNKFWNYAVASRIVRFLTGCQNEPDSDAAYEVTKAIRHYEYYQYVYNILSNEYLTALNSDPNNAKLMHYLSETIRNVESDLLNAEEKKFALIESYEHRKEYSKNILTQYQQLIEKRDKALEIINAYSFVHNRQKYLCELTECNKQLTALQSEKDKADTFLLCYDSKEKEARKMLKIYNTSYDFKDEDLKILGPKKQACVRLIEKCEEIKKERSSSDLFLRNVYECDGLKIIRNIALGSMKFVAPESFLYDRYARIAHKADEQLRVIEGRMENRIDDQENYDNAIFDNDDPEGTIVAN